MRQNSWLFHLKKVEKDFRDKIWIVLPGLNLRKMLILINLSGKLQILNILLFGLFGFFFYLIFVSNWVKKLKIHLFARSFLKLIFWTKNGGLVQCDTITWPDFRFSTFFLTKINSACFYYYYRVAKQVWAIFQSSKN